MRARSRLITTHIYLGTTLFLMGAACARAADVVTFLGIDGMLGPGAVGNYALDAPFSWISHRFPGSATAHLWTLAPGADGGVIVNAAQPGRGQVSAPRPMYNVTSWLFSVVDGVRFDPMAETLNFTSTRLTWGDDVYDFGFGAARTGLVPYVTGPQDAQSANGWWRDAQRYHVVFRGDGQCAGCELTVHLTGTLATAVLGDVAPKGATDGRVDVADLLRLMRFAAELEVAASQEIASADINGDLRVDVRDVLGLMTMLGY